MCGEIMTSQLYDELKKVGSGEHPRCLSSGIELIVAAVHRQGLRTIL